MCPIGPSGVGLRDSCDRALKVICNVRDHFRGTRVVNEQKANFVSYTVGKKRKIGISAVTPCTSNEEVHSVVCKICLLSKHYICHALAVAHKEVLVEAGLEETKVEIPEC